MRALPDPALVREVIDYNPDTGLMVWLPRQPRHFKDGPVQSAEHKCDAFNALWAGALALSCDDGDGYLVGRLFGRRVAAHRAAWAHHYGEWPAGQLDHINGARADNRIVNLRIVDDALNRRNARLYQKSVTGVHGVRPVPSGRYGASITVDRVEHWLGTFDTIEAAASARKAAEARFGFHPNHGLAPP